MERGENEQIEPGGEGCGDEEVCGEVQHDLGVKPLDDARRMREREKSSLANIILYITQIVSSL
jgi:hypothetical protein